VLTVRCARHLLLLLLLVGWLRRILLLNLPPALGLQEHKQQQ
jgi:hypothetical protein